MKKYTVKVIHIYEEIEANSEEEAIDIVIGLSYGEARDCQFECEEDK